MDPGMDDHALISEATARFLGCRPRQVEAVPAGLGARRFFRVSLPADTDPGHLIARIEPAPGANSSSALPAQAQWLPEPPLEPIRHFLEEAGLPVPRSYGHDFALGIDLLEDVGDVRLLDLKGEVRSRGYAAAGEIIIALQAAGRPAHRCGNIAAFERIFDRSLLRTKAWKLKHWGWPGLVDRPLTEPELSAIDEGFERIADVLESAPRCLSHRDFKAENLHQVSGANPVGRLVMIDLQGAILAPPEYDLVCLLRDLQVTLPETFIESFRDQMLSRLPDAAPPETALLRFDLLTLVRLAKDISHLLEAAARGDRRRWHEIPRGLSLLSQANQRLRTSFPGIEGLNHVIDTLTQSPLSADIEDSRQGRG